MQPLIELREAALKRGRTEIVTDIDFLVRPGEHWAILGPNGAGKTTLARLIAGREYPTSGTAVVLGQDTSTEDPTYLASLVGVASQDVRDKIPPYDTAEEVVLSAAWGQTIRFGEDYEKEDHGRAQDLLEALGVGELAQRPFGTLSEGEKQRVAIARALMADPEVLILDEPTAGLDLGAREMLVVALGEIMSGPDSPAILLITHEIEEIAPGFTHAALMKDGGMVTAGPIEEVLTAQNLTETFGLPLDVGRSDNRWWARARTT